MCNYSLSTLLSVVTSILVTGAVFAADKHDSQASPIPAAALSVSLPPECEAVLMRCVKTLRSSRIEYSLVRESPVEGSGGTGVRTTHGRCELDNGKFYFRSETSAKTGDKISTVVSEKSYDGHVFYNGSPNGSPVLIKSLGDNTDDKKAKVLVVNVPYLDAVAFPVPFTVAEWRLATLDSSVLKAIKTGRILQISEVGSLLTVDVEVPDPTILIAREMDLDELAKSPSGSEKVLESYRKVRALDPVRRAQFKLDRDKGYSVQYQEHRMLDGRLIMAAECEEFELFSEGQIWLPRSCTVRNYVKAPNYLDGFSAEPIMVTRIKLETISFGVSNDLKSEIAYGAGSAIVERNTVAARESPSGQIAHLKPTTADSAKEAALRAAAKSHNSWLLIANAIVFSVIAVAAGIHFIRNRMRR